MRRKTPIADYAATAGEARHLLRSISGKQRGDPERAVDAIIEAIESKNPPAHLPLGNDAYDGAIAKLHELEKEFIAWERVSRSGDFPGLNNPRAA